jgi:putative SOS response-associated peptidase YedK
MCGRFTHNLTWTQIHALYQLTLDAPPSSNLQPRFNICPTTTIGAVITRNSKREYTTMRWGLVPSWWKKKAKDTPATFNARAETVSEKPMFRDAFKRRRCLIPASGYYEWLDTPEGKQPIYFTAADDGPLTIAGLWDEWTEIETGQPLKSCTMVIAEANSFVRPIHDRMPVLLEQDQFTPWLSGTAGVEILKPAPLDLLKKQPVSRRVNSSRANDNDPTLIEALELP